LHLTLGSQGERLDRLVDRALPAPERALEEDEAVDLDRADLDGLARLDRAHEPVERGRAIRPRAAPGTLSSPPRRPEPARRRVRREGVVGLLELALDELALERLGRRLEEGLPGVILHADPDDARAPAAERAGALERDREPGTRPGDGAAGLLGQCD